MSQPADLLPAAVSDGKFPVLPVNGEPVQLSKGMVLEITDDDDRVIQAVVGPTPVGKRVPTGFSRTSSGTGEVYRIVHLAGLRIGGEWSKKAIALAYSDHRREYILLFPAVDLIKNEQGHQKIRESEMLYRAVDPDTGRTVKSQRINSVVVTNLAEIGLAA